MNVRKLTKYTALTSNTILSISNDYFGIPICNMKMQKLLYFAYGHYLVRRNHRLIDEQFEAWPYGCVVLSLYTEYSMYKDGASIKHYALDKQGNKEMIASNTGTYNDLVSILSKYIMKSALDLSDLNHEVDGAWWKTKARKGIYLTDIDIKNEFRNRKL